MQSSEATRSSPRTGNKGKEPVSDASDGEEMSLQDAMAAFASSDEETAATYGGGEDDGDEDDEDEDLSALRHPMLKGGYTPPPSPHVGRPAGDTSTDTVEGSSSEEVLTPRAVAELLLSYGLLTQSEAAEDTFVDHLASTCLRDALLLGRLATDDDLHSHLGSEVTLPCCGETSTNAQLLADDACPNCGPLDSFFSFCYGDFVDANDVTHCARCQSCFDAHYWHCANCDRCSYYAYDGSKVVCEHCGSLPRPENIVEVDDESETPGPMSVDEDTASTVTLAETLDNADFLEDEYDEEEEEDDDAFRVVDSDDEDLDASAETHTIRTEVDFPPLYVPAFHFLFFSAVVIVLTWQFSLPFTGFGWHLQFLPLLASLGAGGYVLVAMAMDLYPEIDGLAAPVARLFYQSAPASILGLVLYLALLAYDPLLLAPEDLDMPSPLPLLTHALPPFFFFLDFVLTAPAPPAAWRSGKSPAARLVLDSAVPLVAYLAFLHLCKSQNGYWAYPFIPLLGEAGMYAAAAAFVAAGVLLAAVLAALANRSGTVSAKKET